MKTKLTLIKMTYKFGYLVGYLKAKKFGRIF